MDLEIVVVISRRCSLHWVSKVCVVESLSLSCLLVCGVSASRRWGWLFCLVQILGVAVWLDCKCCWRRSMMWTHWLQRLDDRCPSCAVLWLTGVCRSGLEVLVQLQAVSRSWTKCCRCWLQRLYDRCPDLFNPWLMLWPRKGSLMKTQTRILDYRLYYTRKIELHRKGKKSRTVRITPILICFWQRNLSVLITVRRVHYG